MFFFHHLSRYLRTEQRFNFSHVRRLQSLWPPAPRPRSPSTWPLLRRWVDCHEWSNICEYNHHHHQQHLHHHHHPSCYSDGGWADYHELSTLCISSPPLACTWQSPFYHLRATSIASIKGKLTYSVPCLMSKIIIPQYNPSCHPTCPQVEDSGSL